MRKYLYKHCHASCCLEEITKALLMIPAVRVSFLLTVMINQSTSTRVSVAESSVLKASDLPVMLVVDMEYLRGASLTDRVPILDFFL
jgi:hypothetical protein